MAGKDTGKQPRRANRALAVGDALGRTLDPVFRKRGFATRDLIAYWRAMAPPPYCDVTAPDRLHWPRGEAGAEGAVLFLRCAEGHALAASHDAPLIAAAINRYFGYLLVGAIKLSATPFTAGSAPPAHIVDQPTPPPEVERAVGGVADEGVRAALARLGAGIARRGGR